VANLMANPTIAADLSESSGYLVTALYNGILQENQRLASTKDLAHARQALYYQLAAQFVGIDTQANHLDRDTVVNGLNVQVAFPTFDFPTITQGQSGLLRLVTAYQITGASAQPCYSRVRIVAQGATEGTIQTVTDRRGNYQHTFTWDSSASQFALDVFATYSLV